MTATEAPRVVVTRPYFNPDSSLMQRLKALNVIESALAAANCCPDGYLNLSVAEQAIVDVGITEGRDALTLADKLIELRREGTLFNALKASTQIAELQTKYDALLADVTRLHELVAHLNVRAA